MVSSPLSSLRPREWHKTIHVHVCKKWEYRESNESGPLQHINLVLVDAQVPSLNQPNPSPRDDLMVKDEIGQEIRMTLWASKATQFVLSEDSDSDDTPIIVLFTGFLVKNYFGELHIGGYTACHCYINPEIPEAIALLNRHTNCRTKSTRTSTSTRFVVIKTNARHRPLRLFDNVFFRCSCTIKYYA